jgi:hypothetical protein
LPRLDIEIVHRQSPDGAAEQLSIHLTAVPSFEAFNRLFDAVNPFALWMEATSFAWLPWVELTRAVMFPSSHGRTLPNARSKTVSRSS